MKASILGTFIDTCANGLWVASMGVPKEARSVLLTFFRIRPMSAQAAHIPGTRRALRRYTTTADIRIQSNAGPDPDSTSLECENCRRCSELFEASLGTCLSGRDLASLGRILHVQRNAEKTRDRADLCGGATLSRRSSFAATCSH